jgi:hypothetical protein
MIVLAGSPREFYNSSLMSLETHSGIVDAVRDAAVLTAMHDIAERSNPRWGINHVLITQLVGRALRPIDAEWASLGVSVHEVIVGLIPPQIPHAVIVQRHNIAGLLVDTTKSKTDVLLDVLDSFRRVEPSAHEAVMHVVEAHLDSPQPRHVAMFGAALSYSIQLGDTLNE